MGIHCTSTSRRRWIHCDTLRDGRTRALGSLCLSRMDWRIRSMSLLGCARLSFHGMHRCMYTDYLCCWIMLIPCPLSMITIWKLAPAIATGNVLIIKTPELTPLYGQKLAALILEAGFPPGVINILCGEGRVAGQAIAEHPKIRKVAFTGSTLVGRQILHAAAETNLKRVTLELGGKGPSIVFSDADLENALFWTTLGITANNGQICAAGSRIYVHASIYERFLEEFKGRVAKVVHGDPLLATISKGPLASAGQHQKVLGYINQAKGAGAKLLCGGEDLDGNFISNTAFADVKEDDVIMREEIFGPVAVSSPTSHLVESSHADPSSQNRPSQDLKRKLKSSPRPTTQNTASAPQSSLITSAVRTESRPQLRPAKSL